MRFSFWPNPQQSWTDVLTLARHVESRDWDGIWYADHFMPDDEDTLKSLISAVKTEGGDRMIDSDELREIARRLPVLQEELRALDEQSARLDQN